MISADLAVMWLDRIGNMTFIADEVEAGTIQREYFYAAFWDQTRHPGAEAAIWWM